MRRDREKMYGALFVLLLCASSADAVNFDWAVIGNAGNPADNTGFGSVSYEYSIATTEVTNAQYIEFLNAVATTDTYGLYNSNMGSTHGGITQSGISGSFSYSLKNNDTNWANRPVVYVNWYDALRFVNWLQNGQLAGAQDNTTTEYGAYDMSLGASVVRLAGADYWLPSEDEWYKAAYYSPGGVYYNYATGTDTFPNNNPPDNDTGNSASFYFSGYTLGSPYYTTEVGAYDESESPYGTYDQNGNVWEWNETLIGLGYLGYRGLRGGSWSDGAYGLPSSYRNSDNDYHPIEEDYGVGFRVASSFIEGDAVPEPASVGLLLLSVGGLVLRRAKRA